MKPVLKRIVVIAIAVILVFGSTNVSSFLVYGENGIINSFLDLDGISYDEDAELSSEETNPSTEDTTLLPQEPESSEEQTTELPVVIDPSTEETTTELGETDPPGEELESGENPDDFDIHFTNSHETIVEGESKQLEVVQGLSEARMESITYESSDENVVTISDTGVIEGIYEGEAVVTATSLSGKTTNCNVAVELPPVLNSIRFAQRGMVVQVNTEMQIQVIGEPAKAPIGKIEYRSFDHSIATISSTGVIKGKKAGDVLISIDAGGRGAMASIDVVEFSFASNNITIGEGESKKLSIIQLPVPEMKEEITYSTNKSSVAAVNQNGEVTGIKSGTAIITATTDSGLTASCTVTVGRAAGATKLYFSPDSVSLMTGEKRQLIVKHEPSNEKAEALIFSSSNSNIAMVDAGGVVTGIKAGAATITATTDSGITATCSIKIYERSEITRVYFAPSKVTLTAGTKKALNLKQEPLNAQPEKITYTTSNKKVVTVNSAGTITAIKSGTAIITAKSASGYIAKCQTIVNPKVMLSKTKLTLNYGQRATLKLAGSSGAVTWKSSNKKVVTVKKGQVTGVGVGTAKITAKVGSKTFTCTVTVKRPIINVKSKNLKIKQYVQLKVSTPKKMKWTSSNPKIAYVSQNGKVTARKPGKVTITGKIDSKYTVKCKITVVQQKKSYRAGRLLTAGISRFINMFKAN